MPDFFTLADTPVADVDTVDDECPCENPDDQYLMEIDAGSVYLTHKACRKQPRGEYHDLLQLDRVPVTVEVTPYGNCDGREWHGEHRCDCGIYLYATVDHLAVLHNDQPYLVGRDYKDRDGDLFRVIDLRDWQHQPQVIVLPEGSGEPMPLAEAVDGFGPLTLQPLNTETETTR